MRATAPVLVVLLAGCVSLPGADERCGEVRRRSDGEWLVGTVRASSSPPAYEARVSSALWSAWDAAYEPSACGGAVREGEASAWTGPVLHPGERDAVHVLLLNATNVRPAAWRIEPVASGSVRALGDAWEGEVNGSAWIAFVVEATGEGRGALAWRVTAGDTTVPARALEYVVAPPPLGEPHRVRAR